MNNLTRKIIINSVSNAGSGAAATATFFLSGSMDLGWRILLAFSAGAVGSIGLKALTTWIVNQEKRASRAHPDEVVVAFSRLPVEDDASSAAGGKGRSLARLQQAGFNVPDGFILLPGAFEQDDVSEGAWAQAQKELARLRAGKPQAFAVRSSALQEDSAQASFAGEFESVLDVQTDEDIRAAVRTVLASRRSGRVQSYAQAQSLAAGEHPIAVVIQKLIQPDFAGVLFTADPLTGDLGQMTGNFVEGLGEKLVSGSVTAAAFTFELPKGIYHGPQELAPAARALHQAAHAIEAEMGCPQDIEWAVAGGRVYILQARPITTLNSYDPVNAVWNDTHKGNFMWSATNLMEASPEVLTPFTASLRAYVDANGGPSLSVRGHSLNGIIGGRFYANVSVQVSAYARFFKNDARRAYQEIAGWWGAIPDDMQIPLIPLTTAEWFQGVLPGLMHSTQQFGRFRKQAPQFFSAFPARCASLREKISRQQSGAELAALWQDEIYPLYRDTLIHVIAASSDVQVRLERDLRALVGAEDANVLLSNLSGMSSRLESLGPAAGLGMVLRGEMSREAYLDAYGHRGQNECEIAWPRPAEDPAWLDRQLQEWTAAPVDVDALMARQQAAYEAAWDRFCQKYPGRVKSMQKRIQQAAAAAHQREFVRSASVRGLTVIRAFVLRAGALLNLGEDIFYLTIDEVLSALQSDRPLPALVHLPARKETFARYRALPPYPALISGRFDPFAWAADPNRRSDAYDASQQLARPVSAENDGAVHGFAGALGVVEGTVRRLDSLADSGQFKAGEVLVTTMTNIGWTPLFPRAAAVVTDLGAPLSHAAIVARELGIPAVVGCGNATMRLKTGDRVRVDGGKGLVQIL
ncbi:MAG TPA: PEP/pyruvate-binding domain-containing protein [Anaerolineaceae bacterium]|nr:PEP/pyruvate-binding domain-containing protein [Anaerolineaceae bacterium]HPN50987.1 PEP/pyruvate-binding domain-containing protein [Anaerolineaceae bacterium]